MKALYAATLIVMGLCLLWVAILVAGDITLRRELEVPQWKPVDILDALKEAPRLPEAPSGNPDFWTQGKIRDPFKEPKH